MKYRFFLLAALCANVFIGCSQGRYITKGYAYSREVVSGMARTGSIDENGTVHKPEIKNSLQYLIFAEIPGSAAITVRNVWINGKNYQAGLESVVSTPVVISPNTVTTTVNPGDILVPRTKNKVWQLNITQETGTDSRTAARVLEANRHNQVVIEYMYKGTRNYFPIAVIKKLEPLALQ